MSLVASLIRHSLPKNTRRVLGGVFIAGLVGLSGYGIYTYYPQQIVTEEENAHRAFIEEVYTTIDASYWNTITEEQLVDFYTRVSEHLLDHSLHLETKTKEELFQALEEALATLPDNTARKEFTVALTAQILHGLEPAGRSGLYTEQAAQDLADQVNNVDHDADLYADLGLEKNASREEIAAAAAAKQGELAARADTDVEARKELEKVTYAKDILTTEHKRNRYDSIGALPTVFTKNVTDETTHLYISQFSPSTFDELNHALQSMKKEKTKTLIIDLRDNIGGSLDIVPYMLGPFIGFKNHAFSLYSKEIQDPILTPTNLSNTLKQYRRVIMLANEQTQSSGEVFISTLKKYNVGIFVGKTTRGWGTVERIFPIEHQLGGEETYGMFLVHSLTLDENNQPIEGRGITPDIDITADNWGLELRSYWNDADLIETVQSIWEDPVPKA